MTSRELEFKGGVRTAVGFLLAFTALAVALVPIKTALPEEAGWLAYGVEVAQFLTLAGIGFVFLRAEGVSLGGIGIGRRYLGLALAIFTSVWVVLTVHRVGVALPVGGQWGFASLSNTYNPE